MKMSTGFEKLRTDAQLQNHWLRRLVATVIDAVITGIVGWVLSIPFLITRIFDGFEFFFVWGVVWFIYASFTESSLGWTIGKQAVNLKVRTEKGRIPTMDVALIRNISKVFWPLYLLDVIVGLATPGEPTQKYTDRIAGTVVVYMGSSISTRPTAPTGFSSLP
jgi:uncharacterized RDD family membrane protein YckC